MQVHVEIWFKVQKGPNKPLHLLPRQTRSRNLYELRLRGDKTSKKKLICVKRIEAINNW